MGRETNRSEQTSIETRDVDQQLASSIRGKLRPESPLPSQCCIFRVPISLRRFNENAFVPNLVSIGPFHHKNRKLKAMERVKRWYLHCLLDRSPTPETNLDYFVKAIRDMEPELRECYAEQISLSGDQFVEMMVIDGCFIIELFRKCQETVPRDKDDPVFNMSWMYFPLAYDLFLLENQLPWQVLECLWNLTMSHDELDSYSLPTHALNFFFDVILTTSETLLLDKRSINKHLLDFMRKSIQSPFVNVEPETNTLDNWEPIPCVTELLQAGVKFKLGDANDMLNINFNNGVMKIPPIQIQRTSESLFRNLIAFEQCDPNCTNYILWYAEILDFLIKSSKDVDFLCRRGIIKTTMSTEDIASFFHRLSNGTCITSFGYAKFCRDVNAYYKARRHRYLAILRRDYFNTPWKILSFIAAILILGFTFTQTLFSILSYKVSLNGPAQAP